MPSQTAKVIERVTVLWTFLTAAVKPSPQQASGSLRAFFNIRSLSGCR